MSALPALGFTLYALLLPWLTAQLLVSDVHESELNTRLAWAIILAGLLCLPRLFALLRWPVLGLLLAGATDLAYALVFGGVFSTSTFEAIAATNLHEATEFIAAYTSPLPAFGLLAYLATGVWLWRRLTPPQLTPRQTYLWTISSLLLLAVAGQRLSQGQIHDTLPGVVSAGVGYLIASQGIEAEARHRQTLALAATNSVQAPDTPLTWVVVIGESLNRQHMSLYGYPRSTTPGLEAHASQLIWFNNLISSHVQTQPSLRYALTLANTRDQSDPFSSLSLIDLANLAGMETFWLSNQQPLRGSLTAIARQAQHEYYVSNDFQGVANTPDEALLPAIAQALASPAPRKLIVVHLMGSHLQYQSRYPANFPAFSDAPPHSEQRQLTMRQINTINHYDTSVRYTDQVLTQLLAQLGALPDTLPAGMVFFSDHGEEVFDSKDFKGHGPESLSRPMFTIPLLVWLNPAMQAQQPGLHQRLSAQTDTPAMLDHFDQFLSEWMGLTYPQRRPADSLGNPQWQPAKRLVYGRDFDQPDNWR